MGEIIADRATGYIFANQTDNLSTKAVIGILENIINTFGTPDIIRCDNAGSFRKIFREWADKEGIIINHSSPKNSESSMRPVPVLAPPNLYKSKSEMKIK